MKERLIHLKVKVKSLAAEAVIIRAEAKKVKGEVKHRLNVHRTGVVRWHARHNQLAYGLLRGRPYEVMEKHCCEAPDFAEIAKLAGRFGGEDEEVSVWIREAKIYLGILKEEPKPAGVAQSVEQRICNPSVAGSTPVTGLKARILKWMTP